MFENVKNKIVNGEKCIDILFNRTFKEIENNLNNHNIDINKFIEVVDYIKFRGPVESKNKHYYTYGIKGVYYFDIDFVLKDGGVLNYWYNNNLRIGTDSYIDSFNHIHKLMNDGIKEKYYETKWLKKSKKYNMMIENQMRRIDGFIEQASYKEVVENINHLKFIDDKLGEIVEKLNLDKNECKNKFVMRNVGCFVNNKDKTIVVLNVNKNKLIITFKYNDDGIEVTYQNSECNKI